MSDKPVPRADDEPWDNDAVDYGQRRGCSAWWIMIILAVIFLVWYASTRWWNDMWERPKRSEAHSFAITILNAIDQYHTDYDIFPSPTSAVKGHDVESDTSAAEGLILILKGIDVTANPRMTDYLGEIKDAKTLQGGQRVNGLVRDAEAISLVDPWGWPLIRLDGNGDGSVEDPSHPGTMLKRTAIVWSPGKDGDPDTWDDNVTSWAEAN